MASVLAVLGGVVVLYFIGLGVIEHFEKNKAPDLKSDN